MLKTPRQQNRRLCYPWGHMSYADTLIDLQLDYTLSGMALTVLSPLRSPSTFSQNLVNHKKRNVHVKNLKIFNYDPEVDVPADTAHRDYMEFVVEKVLGHAGDTKKPTTMSFHVKWLNYDDSHNTREPWKSLRLCEALHDYLRDNKMKHFIPKNLETST